MSDPLGLFGQEDELGLFADESNPLGLEFAPEEKSYFNRVVTEGLPAVWNMAADIPNAAVAGLMGAGEVVGSALRGQENPMGQGMDTMTQAMQSMREPGTLGIPRFHGPEVEAMERTAGEALDTVAHGFGVAGETIAQGPIQGPLKAGSQIREVLEGKRSMGSVSGGDSNLGYTLGNVGSNFVPIPGAQLLARVPRIGSIARGKARAGEAAAQEILDRKSAGDAYADADIQLSNEWRKMDEAIKDLDNQMVQYPRDMQAPQLGAGGKVVRHDDQVGKREKGMYANQMAFDEEMRAMGEAYQEYRNQAHGEALEQGVDHLDQYGPTYKGETLDHAPEPVRPHQIEQLREKRISEGEATQIYMKPAFERTLEEKLKLKDYEESLKGPNLTEAVSDPLSAIRHRDEFASAHVDKLDSIDPNLAIMQGSVQDIFRPETRISVRDQLKYVSKFSQDPVNSAVAKLILDDPEFNPSFLLTKDTWHNGDSTAGLWRGNVQELRIHPDFAGNENLLLHEAMHGRTQAAISLVLDRQKVNPIVKGLEPIVYELNAIFHAFKADYNRDFAPDQMPYGGTDLHEFVAEAFSNKSFQNILEQMKIPEGLKTHRIQTYWDKFLDLLGQIFVFKKDKIPHSYLEAVLRKGAELMHASDQTVRDLYTGPNVAASYRFKDFKQELKTKGINVPDSVAKSMFEKYQEKRPETPAHPDQKKVDTVKNIPGLSDIQKRYADNRPFEEVVAEVEKSKDISFVNKHLIFKAIQGGLTAGEHPLLSWTSSAINRIKNTALTKANEKLHGKSRKNPDPGSYNFAWRQMNAKEREQVNRVGWALNDDTRNLRTEDIQSKAVELLGHRLTDKQMAAYQDRVRINKEVLADINKVLKDNDKEAIPELPNYWSPNTFDGPFLLKFVDPRTKETVKIESSYLRPNVEKLRRSMPEAANYHLEVVEQGLKRDVDFDQLDWILRQLHKEQRDPAAKAISEGLRRQGFGKHGLKRRMVEGGEGRTPDRRGLRAYEEISEKYIRSAYDYIANRELDKTFNQILDETKLDGTPNAKAFSLESVDTARGGANKAMEELSRVLGEAFRGTIRIGSLGTLKLPQRALRDVLRHSNKTMTTLLLGFYHPVHITAQILQAPMYAPPAMMAAAARAGKSLPDLTVAVAKALGKSINEFSKWNDSADIKKLQEVGALDATFRFDWSTYASDADPRYRQNLKDHFTGMSALSGLEANAVRRPASLMFLNILRELGYDKIAKSKDEIYHVAREMTDDYMVSTKWYKKPHMFSRTGVVGTAVSPLQSFTTTWAGTLREYTKLAGQGLLEGNVAKSTPLAAFMAANLLTSGMLGLVGVKEWDLLATWLNEHFGYNIPTGSEWIMSKFKGDMLQFGALSALIGSHVGAVFNSPTLTGAGAAGVQFIGNMGNAAYTLGKQGMSEFGLADAPTAQQKRDAMKGVSPRFFPFPQTGVGWGAIEENFTPKGAPYQDLAGNAGPITRDSDDWLARKFSTYTNKEVREKVQNWTLKRKGKERSQRLSKGIEKSVDAMLMNPDTWDRVFDRQLDKLIADGFTQDDIRRALRREIETKLIESDDKMFKGAGNSRKAYLMEILQGLE